MARHSIFAPRNYEATLISKSLNQLRNMENQLENTIRTLPLPRLTTKKPEIMRKLNSITRELHDRQARMRRKLSK